MVRTTRTLLSAAIIVIGATAFWGCSQSTTPVELPEIILLEVDTTTGASDIDTADLRFRLEQLELMRRRREDEIPPIARLREVEEVGEEAIGRIREKFKGDMSILNDFLIAEDLQNEAVEIILEELDIDDPNPENNVGVFVDDETEAVWNMLIGDRPFDSEQDALIALAHVFEYQLAEMIQTREHVSSELAEYVVGICYAVDHNHFLGLYRYLNENGIGFTPRFLTPMQLNSISEGDYITF